MRIAHIIESSSGGSAKAALTLVQGLASRGHDVTLVYSTLRADTLFAQALDALQGVTLHEIPMNRRVGLNDIVSWGRLALLLRRLEPFDIIHAHSSKAGALARLAGPFSPSAQVVYTPHAFVTMAPRASCFYKMAERLLSHLGRVIIAVSLAEKEHAVRVLQIAPQKIVVIPNGLDLDGVVTREQARVRMGYRGDDIVLGFVGRLSAQKRPDRLIDSFAQASALRPQLKLAVIGNGELLNEMKSDLARREMLDRVRIWSDHDARFFVPGFDALLCSSDYEGFPLTFIEALSSGVPIITTPVGGSAEAVEQGETGFIADGFEAEALASAITAFLNLSAEARLAMAERARERASFFTSDRMVASVEALYAELAAERTKG